MIAANLILAQLLFLVTWSLLSIMNLLLFDSPYLN
jgi:hypothetical protein